MKKRTLKFSAYTKWGWRKKTSVWSVGFGILFLITSIPMLSMMPKEERLDTKRIATKGEQHIATIVSIESNKRITVNGQNPIVIKYTFIKENKTLQGFHQTMSFDRVAKLKTGEPITIRYLDGKSLIQGMDYYQFPYWVFSSFYIFPLIFVSIGGISLFLFFKKRIHLHCFGEKCEAVVDSLEPLYYIRAIRFRSSSQIHHRLYYTFITKEGNVESGSDVTTDKLIIDRVKNGDIVEVVYSEKKPSYNCIFEAFLTREEPTSRWS